MSFVCLFIIQYRRCIDDLFKLDRYSHSVLLLRLLQNNVKTLFMLSNTRQTCLLFSLVVPLLYLVTEYVKTCLPTSAADTYLRETFQLETFAPEGKFRLNINFFF